MITGLACRRLTMSGRGMMGAHCHMPAGFKVNQMVLVTVSGSMKAVPGRIHLVIGGMHTFARKVCKICFMLTIVRKEKYVDIL